MSTIAASASTAPSSPSTGLLLRRWPVFVILSSFFVITLPLCLFGASVDPDCGWSVGMVYLAAFGISHFLLTFTVYLQSANLRHFQSNRTNQIGYFLVPLVIFVVFDLYRALEVAILLPALDFVFRIVIRLVDFQHSARQGYGVLQLVKARAGGHAAWVRPTENYYFTAMTLLVFQTALTGGRMSAQPAALVVTAVAALLGVAVLVGHVMAWHANGRRSLSGIAYFSVQSACLWMSAYRTELYGFALAMHYVEYHLLMAPRCFQTPLDPTSRVDRLFGAARAHKVLAYGLLLAVAGVVTHVTWLSMGQAAEARDAAGTVGYRALVALFDGLFVFHYVVDAWIWKFSDPYYRRMLGPLYFGTTAPPRTEATPDEAARRDGLAHAA
jgi:hypothetical protein